VTISTDPCRRSGEAAALLDAAAGAVANRIGKEPQHYDNAMALTDIFIKRRFCRSSSAC
jgi:hypothetical protein